MSRSRATIGGHAEISVQGFPVEAGTEVPPGGERRHHEAADDAVVGGLRAEDI
jgi:hypothetical protein